MCLRYEFNIKRRGVTLLSAFQIDLPVKIGFYVLGVWSGENLF